MVTELPRFVDTRKLPQQAAAGVPGMALRPSDQPDSWRCTDADARTSLPFCIRYDTLGCNL